VNLVNGQVATLRLVLTIQASSASVTVRASSADAQVASSATKTDTELLDIPQSIQVVPGEILNDQIALTMGDVVRNVSGVTVPFTSGGRMENLVMRGFLTNFQLKDGFRNDFWSNRAGVELANVDRVEVLKGPSSALYGRLDPTGVLNLVTKQPLSDLHFSGSFTTGSYSYWRGTVDITGPLSRRKTGSEQESEKPPTYAAFRRTRNSVLSAARRCAFSSR